MQAMRVLLDSRDLINLLEYDQPFPSAQFESFLREQNHQAVLTFTNIRELAGPLARGEEFIQVRQYLQVLESIPHLYLHEVPIPVSEIGSAVDAFLKNTEYENYSPYVPRWDYTVVPLNQNPATQNWIRFTLDEIVFWINRVRPDVFAPPNHVLQQLQEQFAADREALRNGQASAREHFSRTISNHIARFRIPVPQGREEELASWIYGRADRCPGLRFHHEVYRALMENYQDIPEAADFSDFAHVGAIPYVDAATLDNRMRHYCGVASQRILRAGGAHDYSERLYRDLRDFVHRNPVPA